MRRNLLNLTLIALGFVIFSCLITMMVMFVSLTGGGGDQMALLGLQAAAASVAVLIVAIDLALRVTKEGWQNGLRSLWAGIPAWLVLVLVLLNSLVLIGELGHIVLQYQDSEGMRPIEHAPLACIVFCSLAFCALYDRAFHDGGERPAGIGRWSA